MAGKMFEASKLNVKYGDIQVLWDVSFDIGEGEIIAIVGSNGAGKSTTVKTCSGIMRAASGTISYDGVDLSKATARQYVDQGIIMVPEGRQLFPQMTVYENLEMGASSKEAKARMKETVANVFQWFPILEERKKQLAGTLSGGEQQMLAFSRGMMGLPKLLLMDEPSLGLAPTIVDSIFALTKEISQKQGLSVILVEQDVKKALRIANRGYVLENGRITIAGTSQELLTNPDVKKAYLGF